MKDNRAMFKSMDTEIMQISILVDEMLKILGSEAIMEAALPFLHFVSMGEIERFQRSLLKFRDILDAEASVEWWIIDDLRLGKVKGLIFEDEQLPRSETSGVLPWWRQLRPALETALDVLDEVSISTSISQKNGFHIFTNRHKQRQRSFSDYSMDMITGVITRVWKILNDSIILKPPDPKRIDAPDADRSHDIVGRQDDVNRIVELLVSTAHFETTTASAYVHVVPIVGDSGFGKTIVAKLVYSDDRVERHFDKKMWINFSNRYLNTLESTKSLLQSSAVGEAPPNDIIDGAALDLESLKSLLHTSLDGNKFLLVLDGVSNEICCDWSLLHVNLIKGKIGSKILVTTRSSYVSSTLGTVPPSYLQPLSFEDSWLLFTSITSRNNTSSSPLPSQCYKDMVEWFHGFPSLVIALGEFSHSKPNEKEIKAALVQVRRDHNSHSHISSGLLRRYHSLSPMHLKQCFLYCALLPKGYRFQKHKLVWLWMAEGFLQSEGTMTMEEVGFTYFGKLMQASFIGCKCDDFIHHDSSSYVITDLAQDLLHTAYVW